MMLPDTNTWLGSEQSFHRLDSAMRHALKHPDPTLIKMYDDDDEDERNPVQIEKVGGLAILSISGGMMNRTSWLTRYLGIPTYQDIRSQVTRMAQADDVQAIMLNLDTSGGMAEGCFSLCRFIRAVSDQVKNVITFTDSKAFSAGYALMVSGAKKLMSEDASAGSVGVIAIHAELTEMYKDIGIKHTVFRSAPFKALGQSVEKLTAQAEAEIQKEIMVMHNTFVSHIANMTGLETGFINKEVANGKTFSADESLRKKMVDNVMTFEAAVGKITTALEKQRPSKPAIPQTR